jgi:uncharacterized protein YbcC (UPF0753/DUF2309 family)
VEHHQVKLVIFLNMAELLLAAVLVDMVEAQSLIKHFWVVLVVAQETEQTLAG